MENGRYTGVISIRIKILFLLSDIDGKGFCANVFPQRFTDILVANIDSLFLGCFVHFVF